MAREITSPAFARELPVSSSGGCRGHFPNTVRPFDNPARRSRILLMTEAAHGYVPKTEQQKLDNRYESVKKMLAKLFGAVSRES